MGLGGFEVKVSLGHLGRDIQSVRQLGWRSIFRSGHDCRAPEALGIDEVTREHSQSGFLVVSRLQDLMRMLDIWQGQRKSVVEVALGAGKLTDQSGVLGGQSA